MKKTIMERLGLEPVNKLNKTICRERVRELKKRIEAGKIPKSLQDHAEYYARWYAWMAKNGGTRAKKKTARTA